MKISRRSFLKGSSVLYLGFSLTPNILFANNDDLIIDDLADFCFNIFPHDGLNKKYYKKCAKELLNGSNKELMKNGIKSLNKVFDTSFSKLNGNKQEEAFNVIISTHNNFFLNVKSYLVTGLYNNSDTWDYFGYEGASFPFGGYLNRGFDDISWIKG